jgi:hypothetical protein
LKIPNTKRAGGVAQGIGPEFKPQCSKKEIYWSNTVDTPRTVRPFNETNANKT